jgi:peptide deformylase
MSDFKLVEPKHPALHKKADIDPFTLDVDLELREKEMVALMVEKYGLGLASPQIGESVNMFVMKHSLLGPIGVYNPEILETTENISMEEGCLTFPFLYMHVSRPEKVKVRYTTSNNTPVEMWLEGMDARCFLHEFEHLQGQLFIDNVSEMKLRRAIEKREKLFKKLERQVKNA